MNERELRLLQQLASRLQGIEQEINAIRICQERREHQRDIQPIWATPILSKNDQSETNNAALQNKNYGVQNSLRWATWCAFAAAAIYAGIAYWQKSTMDDTFQQVKSQTEINTIAMHLDQRAWLKVSAISKESRLTVAPGKDITFRFQVTDSGKTPARNVDGAVTARLLNTRQEPDFIYGLKRDGHPKYTMSRGLVPPSSEDDNAFGVPITVIDQKGDPIILTEDTARSFSAGNMWVAVYARFTYKDVFDVPHWLNFCEGIYATTLAWTSQKCAPYNDIDQNK